MVGSNRRRRILLFILMTKLIIPKKGILVPKYVVDNREARKKTSEFIRKQREEYEKNNYK